MELAGGTGNWTVELERLADTLTVVDSSPETLAINHSKLADSSRVEFVVADVFEFEPVRRFDVVFFSFWRLVDRCLAPGGRVVVIDSAHPSMMCHAPDSGSAPTSRPTEYVGGQGGISLDGGTAERVLDDGSRRQIIKRFWMPEVFEAEMAGLGWNARARNTRFFFLLAELERESRGA